MQKKVQIFLDKYHMIERGECVVTGVSGGADSVCLLLLLKELSAGMGFSLVAVHVEHGIRGQESLDDAAFTQTLCEQMKIPFLKYSVDAAAYADQTGKTLEEAARELRYRCFFRACEKYGTNKIAVAHHANDNAETMLFHLARGTGIRGLCGISPVTDISGWYGDTGKEIQQNSLLVSGDPAKELYDPSGKERKSENFQIIRPLLCLAREEIEEWLEKRQQIFCTDSTNEDVAYTRNRIRGRVIPELEIINEQTVQHMEKTALQLMEICSFLDDAVREAQKKVCQSISDENGGRQIYMDCAGFSVLHPVIKKELVLEMLAWEAGSRKDIASGHVNQVMELFENNVGKRISLPYQIEARRAYDAVVLSRCMEQETKPEKHDFSRELIIPGEIRWGNGVSVETKIMDFHGISQKIPQNRYTKWFDYDKIKDTVQLRTRREGDYLQTDSSGGHKKLKKYFIDEKIPKEERDQIFLLADESHILWVIGYRISEAYKVTQETKRILCVQISGGERYHE